MISLRYHRPNRLRKFCTDRLYGRSTFLSKTLAFLLICVVALHTYTPITIAQSGGSDSRKEATATWTPSGATQADQTTVATATWTTSPTKRDPTPTWTLPVPTATTATNYATTFPATATTIPPLPTVPPLPTTIPGNSNGSQNAATPRIFISEFLANPAAVADAQGEFVEIWNGDTVAVNLRGWVLADQDSDSHTISTDLFIAPDAYVVLGRNADSTTNGGIQVDYLLSDIQLANGADELLLFAPDGSEVDRVLWGGSSILSTTAGASLERTDPANPNSWQTASTPWPGSAGDLGSPGAAFGSLPNTPTPTATSTETITTTATATTTVTVTGTTTAVPTITPTVAPTATVSTPTAQLLITELMANPAAVADSAGEFIELYNPGSAPVNLNGWTLADEGSDRHTIMQDLLVPPGGYLVLARNGDAATNGGVPVEYVYSGINLANGEDELLLFAPDGSEVERVLWGGASGLAITPGASLERMTLDDPALWITAQSQWPGSLGDLGSPGAAYVPAAATGTPEATPTVPLIATPSPTRTPVVAPSVTATPFSGPPPQIVISEIMANPAAVADAEGEFFELYNPGPNVVNLAGWTIADLGSDRHTIVGDLLIPAGGYVLLARDGDGATNGGVNADYIYAGISLANSEDELILFAPDGSEVERVLWGGDSALRPVAGASLERVLPAQEPLWQTATTLWPGSAGDLGSPGSSTILAEATNTPSPTSSTPVVTTTPAASPVASPIPSLTPLPTVAPTLSAHWQIAPGPSAIQIEEVAFRGSDEEYVALINVQDVTVDLGGLLIGDAQVPGNGEGVYSLPLGATLAAGELFVIARNGAAYRAAWGQPADAEFGESEAGTPSLERRRDFATGSWALKDGGDEVVLLDSTGQLLDAVAYAGGDYAALQLTGELRPPTGFTLQRVPGFEFPTERDLRHRFLAAPAQPRSSRQLPLGREGANPLLDHGLLAVWGSLGGQSNFTPGQTAPPHYLASAAGALGLDFMAIADPLAVVEEVRAAAAPNMIDGRGVLLPAWSWVGSDDDRAIVYERHGTVSSDRQEFLRYIAEFGSLVQWQGRRPPSAAGIVASDGEMLGAISDLKRLEDLWRSADLPLIPAGNSNPPLPGLLEPHPRYSGLAVEGNDGASIRRALAARRGWLTTRPGIWLTLGADVAGEGFRWMGERLLPADQVTLHIYYGDLAGEIAGLAIWQDGQPIRQLDLPPVGGRWSVQLPAVADTFLFAVATQRDGDFAVTAPLQVLPDPAPDGGHDGRGNADDQTGGGEAKGEAEAKAEEENPSSIDPNHGQATGPPGSLADAKLRGLTQWVEFRAVVIAPPGLFNSSIYVAEAAPTADSPLAGLGIQVYLRRGIYPPLVEGDRVLLRGVLDSFRGELELVLDDPGQIWRIGPGVALEALPVSAGEIGESLEGRLVSFSGVVEGWSRDSIYLRDPADPMAEAVRVTVRSSLGWRRPYVNEGELWRVRGITSQFAREEPWNDGYRVLVRYPEDLERLSR